jgi:hypothetical protein
VSAPRIRKTVVVGSAFSILAIDACAMITSASATTPLPAPNACAPNLCVGFPLGIGEGLSIRPRIEIAFADGRTTMIADYGPGAEIRVMAESTESSFCDSADGTWRRTEPHRIEARIQLPPARYRAEAECRYLAVETAGLPGLFEQSLNIDFWLMTDYYPGSSGDFVTQPVEQWLRLFLRDVQ